MKKVIKFKDLAQVAHIKLLDSFQKQANLAMDLILDAIFTEIKRTLRKDKLAKSDNDNEDDSLGVGWIGEVSNFNYNLSERMGSIIEKYLKALRWVALGDMAGKESKDIAKELKLFKKVIPGLLPATYLQSLDTERQHYKDIYGTNPEQMPKDLVKASLDKIKERADRTFEPMLSGIKTNILNMLDRVITDNLNQDIDKMHKEAMDVLNSEGREAALDAAREVTGTKIKRLDLTKEIEAVTEGIRRTWERNIGTELAGSSAVGSHQSMYEVFGAESEDIKVAIITQEDPKVCSYCFDKSFDKDGNYIYYKIGDFKPAGWNFSRKKKEWELCIAPIHYNCRCRLIYVPVGFKMTKGGDLVKA